MFASIAPPCLTRRPGRVQPAPIVYADLTNIDVVPLAEAQIEDAARILALAFHDDPLFCYVHPDPEERARCLPERFSFDIRFGHLFGEAYTTAGTPQGVAVWQPAGSEITPERAKAAGFDRLPALVGRDALVRLGKVLDYLEAFHHRDMTSEHWYLMAVGVVPARQGQGIGRALLQPVLKRAGADGLPCFLDTPQPRNVPFYEKLGFRILVETVEPESGLRWWTFRRDPA